jgi:glutathione S-transferase
MPCLELDDGTYLAEITALCECPDEKYPGPSLLGPTPEERAATRMWMRCIDIIEPMAKGFGYSDGLKPLEKRVCCLWQAAADVKQITQETLARRDGLMAGKTPLYAVRAWRWPT